MSISPRPDAYGVADNCTQASVDYFIEIFGFEESLQLSNIENPTGNEIDYRKIQVALNDAAQLIKNYITTAPPQGKILIAGSFRRTQSVIARWYLDSLRPREHVTLQAKEALQQLELWAAKGSPSDGFKWQEAYRFWGSGCTMVRSQYSRGRSFTEPSLNRWQHLEGPNDRFFRAPRKEATVARRGGPEHRGIPQDVNPIGDSALDMNRLVDALESTRTLDSFTNTRDAVDPADGELLVADNLVEDADGNFDTYDGLMPEGEF
jgi:phage gp36-like protein